jgi:hypothetical protein
MENFWKKFLAFLKSKKEDIFLIIGIILISLLAFSLGYLTAKLQERAKIEIEGNFNESSNYWCWNNRTLFG